MALVSDSLLIHALRTPLRELIGANPKAQIYMNETVWNLIQVTIAHLESPFKRGTNMSIFLLRVTFKRLDGFHIEKCRGCFDDRIIQMIFPLQHLIR